MSVSGSKSKEKIARLFVVFYRRLLRMLRTFPPLSLPDNALSFEGQKFLDLVSQACGSVFKELMEVLSINSVHKLLMVENEVLSVFQKNYRELASVSKQACLHLDDGTLMLKPGLRLDFERFIAALRFASEHSQQQESLGSVKDDLLSLLKKCIHSYQLSQRNDSGSNYSFLVAFVENIVSNLVRNRNNYRYSEAVQHFAHALFILGGRNVYEFIRLNLPGALPSLSAVSESLAKAGASIEEGVFRYDKLQDNQKLSDYQFVVCSEDATAVVKKVTYSAATNTFTGFSIPLRHGIPTARHFQTDSFDQLKMWFQNKEKADLLNIHMVQPLTGSYPHLSPFLLAAYGISNKFKAVDVLNRWIWIFEKSKKSNVRILSFATDCDPRYLLAMRLATGFFAKYVDTSVFHRDDAFEIALPKEWSTWFFMPQRQVFFCFQDPVHLCTKIRNRLLSETATMLMGNEEVSIGTLIKLIESKTKLAHGLVKTDIEPKDRQNFASCLKIASDDVLSALEDVDRSQAMQIYLRLLRSIIVAYVERGTSILERVYHSWFAVFLCRIWHTWTLTADRKDMSGYFFEKDRKNLFITLPAYFSIELNAHTFLCICLLVCQRDLPDSALAISNYHSQSCESTFRLARSMSGVFSSIVNFTTEQFLKRGAKLCVLADLENRSQSGQLDCPLQFPKHHKRRRKSSTSEKAIPDSSSDKLTHENIKKAIDRAFTDAYNLLAVVDVNIALERKKKTTLNQVSSFIRGEFEKKFKKVAYEGDESYLSDDEDDDGDELSYARRSDRSWLSSFDGNESSEDEDDVPSVSASGKSQFHGLRVFDTISPASADSYFRIEIDGKRKYMHKQTACWLLTDGKAELSADRLKRVQQTSR